MTNKKIAKILQKSASAMMAFTILATSMPVGFSTNYVATVAAQSASTTNNTTASQKIAGLSVSTSWKFFQTFDNPYTGVNVSKMTVAIGVVLSENYQEGGLIKLPLPVVPTDSAFAEVDGAFFYLDNPQEHSIVKEFDTTSEPGFLKIFLKSKDDQGFAPWLSTIPLSFSFNNFYKRKIPNNTIMYTISPEVYISGERQNIAVNPQSIYASSGFANAVSLDNFNPIDPTKYPGGAISVRARHHGNHIYSVLFDKNKTNQFILQVPTGSILSRSDLYTYDKKVIIAGVEYDQYVRNITVSDTGEVSNRDFNVWAYDAKGETYVQQHDFSITPPLSLQKTNSVFKIRLWNIYNIINHKQTEKFLEREYTYVARKPWVFDIFTAHGTGGSTYALSGTNPWDRSLSQVVTVGHGWTHSSSTKNMGSQSIRGVKYELFNPGGKIDHSDSSSPRMNFHSITLRPDYPAGITERTKYKYSYEIVDTKRTVDLSDDTTRIDESDTYVANGISLQLLTLPKLAEWEYISKVIVTPMGIDGQSEWELLSQNSFAVFYHHKAWDDQKWPDGTPITRYAEVRPYWQLHYMDNPNKPEVYPENGWEIVTRTSGAYPVYYTNSPYAGAKAATSQTSLVPGDVVRYDILWYNPSIFTANTWVNPKIFMRVPSWMILRDIDTPKILTQATGNITAPVQARLTHSDAEYNYYEFFANNYTAPRYGGGSSSIFTIPVDFEIKPWAKSGSHDVMVYASQGEWSKISSIYASSENPTSGLSSGVTKEKLGLSQNDNYLYLMASTPVNILRQSSAKVSTTIKNSATNGIFSPASVVPAKSNEDVTMRLMVRNTGSTELDRLKIYNILPYNNDALGSNGNIVLKDVASSKTGFTVKTTKTPVADLPKYGEHNTANAAEPDLQTTTIAGNWSNGVPTDKTGLSGLFVDFGNTRILPGEEVTVDLTFTIPDEVSQRAFNQFRYSAQEVGNANVKFNLNSTKAGFDTTYIDNVVPVVTLAGNTEMSVRQNATFTDPGATWTDNIDGTGRIAKGIIVEKNGQPVTNGGTDIDTTEIATYKLEYTYTDVGGNSSNKVHRTLRVTDGTAPNIVFKGGVVEDNGTYRLNVEMKSNFNPEDYVTITDNVAVAKKGSYLGNSEPTTLPTTFATVDTNTPGQKIVSYVAADASGNKTTKKLVLNVRDSQAPNITLVGNATISIPVGSTFTDAGANWTDAVDGGGNVKAFEGSVDANTVGSYTLKYKHTDAAGNVSQIITRTVNVTAANKTALNKIIDAVSPISTNPEKIAKIVGINGVDTATAKSTLEAAFEESKTVKANPNAIQAQVDEATRKLTAALANVALDTEKPVITIAPTAQNTYTVGATVDKMAGVTATDKVRPSDNAVDITGSITIDSENPDFNPNKVGTYTITYVVTDSVGNTTKISRTITISEADNSALVTKVQEAERAIANPKVVADGNKDTLAEEIRKAKEIIADKDSTPEVIAAAITALQDAITALIVDTIAPVVTPNASLPTQIKVGDAIDVTVGLTSVDNIDGDISSGVTYIIAKVTGYEASGEPILGEAIHTGTHGDGEKNFTKIGTVAVVYTSTDAKNNTTRAVRVVSVERADNDLLGTAITEGEQAVTNPNTVHNPALDDLKKAIEDGKKVFNDENSTQAQIDEAKAKIDDAKSKVDARDPAKVKDLRDLIDATDVKLTNPHLVHDDTKKALDDALNKARDILGKNTTTNQDLDDAINAINDLINDLQERDPNGFDDLRDAIANGQNISNDPNTVHNDVKTNLDKAIEDATKILDNPSTTQQQIDDAKKVIEDLITQVEKRDPANFDDLDDFIKKAEDASNAPDVVNDDKKADLDKKIKDLKEMKDDPKTSNEDIVNKKKEILDAIAALNKKAAGPGGYAGGGSTGGGSSNGGGSSTSPIHWDSPIVPDTTPTNTDGNNNGGDNNEENTSLNSAPTSTSVLTNTQVVETPKVDAPKTEIPVSPRVENGNILTQHITAKEGTENTFSVTNPLTNAVCIDIIRAHTYDSLVVKDNPQTAPFHDDIAALMMFRGAEKTDNNIPNYEEYKRDGVVLNAEYFSPNRSVTRAEFVKMLVRSLSCHYTHLGTDTGFSDVEGDKWYAEYIKFAAESKWINGYADGTFRPNAPITRDEAAKILSRAISLDTANTTTETEFSDVEKGSEFIPYIESLKNLGVMKGRTSEQFAPKEQISRGETARIIYRTFFGGKL